MYASWGFCHLKRCGNEWDLMTQILALILHEFILWFSLSLVLSGHQDGGFAVLFFQLIFITRTHKTAQAPLPPFVISQGNSGVSQGCRKPRPMASTQQCKTFTLLMQIPALHLWLGQSCKGNLPPSWLNPGYTQSCWELLEMPFSSLKHSLPLLGCGPCMTSPHWQHWLDWHFKQKAGSPRRLK